MVKHHPIVSQGDVSETWDARQNVIDSKHYEQLLATSPAFRRERMRIECGPITDPQLHQSCQLAGLPTYTGVFIAATANAQSPTALEQAELAGLSPDLRY